MRITGLFLIPVILANLLFPDHLGTRVRAQTYETLALEAYLQNDLDKWDAALAATEAITDPEHRLLTRAEYQLGRAYAAMAAGDDAARNDALDQIDENLDELWEINERNAVAHGLYSGLLGLKIARRPIMGMIYGSKAGTYAERAAELGPENGAALYHAASNLYYTPEQWGGDLTESRNLLERAVETYGPDRNDNWRYLNTLALLGQVRQKLGDTEGARLAYEKALAAQPEFGYVRNVLLPALEQK
jgi:tetratricopeptide (TPR) repeat protein